MRRWVRALHPAREAGLTGRPALDAIADAFRTTGLHVQLTGSGDPALLGDAASLVAYRVVQEGLTNALRHSDAARVGIDLAAHTLPGGRPALRVAVTNAVTAEAVGDPLLVPGGFGLRSLADRVAGIGGVLDAGPRDGQFVLAATLPTDKGTAR